MLSLVQGLATPLLLEVAAALRSALPRRLGAHVLSMAVADAHGCPHGLGNCRCQRCGDELRRQTTHGRQSHASIGHGSRPAAAHGAAHGAHKSGAVTERFGGGSAAARDAGGVRELMRAQSVAAAGIWLDWPFTPQHSAAHAEGHAECHPCEECMFRAESELLFERSPADRAHPNRRAALKSTDRDSDSDSGGGDGSGNGGGALRMAISELPTDRGAIREATLVPLRDNRLFVFGSGLNHWVKSNSSDGNVGSCAAPALLASLPGCRCNQHGVLIEYSFGFS